MLRSNKLTSSIRKEITNDILTMAHVSLKHVTYFVLGFLVATCMSYFHPNDSARFVTSNFFLPPLAGITFPKFRYTVIFKHDSYVDILSYYNDNYVDVVNQCSKGTHPERVNRKRTEAFTVEVRWCRMIKVKVICKEFWMKRDYIPRNYEYLITFNKVELDIKSLMFHKNNVDVVVEKTGGWELPEIRLKKPEEPVTIDLDYQLVHGSAPYRALPQRSTVAPNITFLVLQDLVLILFVPCFTIILVLYKTLRKKTELTRSRPYDAFVSFHHSGPHRDFVFNRILLELEENHDPTFRLYIHDKDFELGKDIMWNIENAIQQSNSAIIVMSQGYVDSKWCRIEFRECYLENAADPTFHLFVIMMEPEESLENKSDYMEKKFIGTIFGIPDDPNLFVKLGKGLMDIRPKS